MFLYLKGAFDIASHKAIIGATADVALGSYLLCWVGDYDRFVFMFTPVDTIRLATKNVVRQVRPQGMVIFRVTTIDIVELMPKNGRVSIYADDICL